MIEESSDRNMIEIRRLHNFALYFAFSMIVSAPVIFGSVPSGVRGSILTKLMAGGPPQIQASSQNDEAASYLIRFRRNPQTHVQDSRLIQVRERLRLSVARHSQWAW